MVPAHQILYLVPNITRCNPHLKIYFWFALQGSIKHKRIYFMMALPQATPHNCLCAPASVIHTPIAHNNFCMCQIYNGYFLMIFKCSLELWVPLWETINLIVYPIYGTCTAIPNQKILNSKGCLILNKGMCICIIFLHKNNTY